MKKLGVILLVSILFCGCNKEKKDNLNSPEKVYLETHNKLLELSYQLNKGYEKTRVIHKYEETKNIIFDY